MCYSSITVNASIVSITLFFWDKLDSITRCGECLFVCVYKWVKKKNQVPYVPHVTNTRQRQFYCYLLPEYQKSEIQPKTFTSRCALDAHAIIEQHKQTEKPSRDTGWFFRYHFIATNAIWCVLLLSFHILAASLNVPLLAMKADLKKPEGYPSPLPSVNRRTTRLPNWAA